jgi:hypothetical protein
MPTTVHAKVLHVTCPAGHGIVPSSLCVEVLRKHQSERRGDTFCESHMLTPRQNVEVLGSE